MPTAYLDGDRVVVRTEYFEKDTIAAVPGASYRDGRWTIPATWPSMLALRGLFGPALKLDQSVIDWAWQMRQHVIEPSQSWRNVSDYSEGDPALYGFQRAGVVWLGDLTEHALQYGPSVHSVGRGLGDEMGAGKTVQVISAWKRLRDPFPALVIAPRSVKRKWERHIHEWWPGLEVVVVGGSAKQRREALATPAHVYIMHWEIVRLHSRLAPFGNIRLRKCRDCGGLDSVSESACEVHVKELNLMGLRSVVADEAHRLFDPHSKWTRATWAVGHERSVIYRWALTGTMLGNALDDTWGILHFLDPDAWRTRSKFIDRYCLKSWNAWGGLEVIGVRPDTATEFYAAFDTYVRRMPKELVLPHLPPKVREIRDAPMSAKQKKAYTEMDEGLITRTDDGDVIYATNRLVASTRLIQFSSAFAEVNDDGDVRLSEPSSKLDVLEEILLELGWRWATKANPAKTGEPVVVFAAHRQLLELASKRLEKYGVRHFLLTGGQTDDQRDAIVHDFNTGPPSVILVVLKAGGEGIDLVRARHVVFLQRSWSMLENKQAEDRVHRIGSERHASIVLIDVVAPDTKEVEQIEVLHEKMRRLEEINRDKIKLQQAGAVAEVAQLESEEATIMRSDLL